MNLPAGIGGRQCSWTGADARAVVLETRVDADLDPVLVADHETAVSVLQESIATEAGTLTPIAGLGTVAFIGHGHVYVAAAGGTLVLDDEAGLDQQAEVALARSATDRL